MSLVSTERNDTLPGTRYPEIWALYKSVMDSLWLLDDSEEDVDRFDTFTSWMMMFDDHLYVYETALLLYLPRHIGPCVWIRQLEKDAHIYEAKVFFGLQNFVDGMHSELILAFGRYILHNAPTVERFDDVRFMSSYFKRRDEWTERRSGPYSESLIAYALTKSVFGSSLLVLLQSDRLTYAAYDFVNVLSVIAHSNRRSVRFACVLFSLLENKCSNDRVLELVCEAVEIEKVMVKEFLATSVIRVEYLKLCQYIESVADDLIVNIGLKPFFDSKNPYLQVDSSVPRFSVEESIQVKRGEDAFLRPYFHFPRCRFDHFGTAVLDDHVYAIEGEGLL